MVIKFFRRSSMKNKQPSTLRFILSIPYLIYQYIKEERALSKELDEKGIVEFMKDRQHFIADRSEEF